MMATEATTRRPIYYFDIVHDYPSIGGVVEFSQTLSAELKRRFGARLVSVRETLPRSGADLPYLARETHAAEWLAEAHPDAVFVFPNFHSPIARHRSGIRPTVINVVHDVQFAFLPELFAPTHLAWLHRAFAETRSNADEIVFVSKTTRDQFIACFGAPRRHQVIHNPVVATPAARGTAPVAPFLLAVAHGDHHPHKNIDGLLGLFAGLAARRQDLTLHVTGQMSLERLAAMAGDMQCQVLPARGEPGEQAEEAVDILVRVMIAMGDRQQKGRDRGGAARGRRGDDRIMDDLVAPRRAETGDELVARGLADEDDLVGIAAGFSESPVQPSKVGGREQLGKEGELHVVHDIDDGRPDTRPVARDRRMEIGEDEDRVGMGLRQPFGGVGFAGEIRQVRARSRQGLADRDEPCAEPPLQLRGQRLRKFDDTTDRGVIMDDIEIVDRASRGCLGRHHRLHSRPDGVMWRSRA